MVKGIRAKCIDLDGTIYEPDLEKLDSAIIRDLMYIEFEKDYDKDFVQKFEQICDDFDRIDSMFVPWCDYNGLKDPCGAYFYNNELKEWERYERTIARVQDKLNKLKELTQF